MKNKQTSWFGESNRKLTLGVLLLALVVVGGFYLYQENSADKVTPLNSSADNPTPWHWYHTTVPFNLKLKDTSADIYATPVKLAINSWKNSGAFTPIIKSATRGTTPTCEYEYGFVKFCSQPRIGYFGALAEMSFSSTPQHIIYQAYVTFSDELLASNTEYSTPEYRNYLACDLFGNALMATVNVNTNFPPPDSCMEGTTIENVAAQQAPQKVDLRRVFWFYQGNIDPPLPISDTKSPTSATTSDIGELTEVSPDGLLERYELMLDNGDTKVTVLALPPAK